MQVVAAEHLHDRKQSCELSYPERKREEMSWKDEIKREGLESHLLSSAPYDLDLDLDRDLESSLRLELLSLRSLLSLLNGIGSVVCVLRVTMSVQNNLSWIHDRLIMNEAEICTCTIGSGGAYTCNTQSATCTPHYSTVLHCTLCRPWRSWLWCRRCRCDS